MSKISQRTSSPQQSFQKNKCSRKSELHNKFEPIQECNPRFDLATAYAAAVYLLRKEVIQPQVPLRLPCYDFIPITNHTFGACLLAVNSATSGTIDFHDVTGGVYKAWERIHAVVADTALLAIPPSCRRVAAYNLNWARFFGFAPPRGLASHCTGHCSTCAALAVRAILT